MLVMWEISRWKQQQESYNILVLWPSSGETLFRESQSTSAQHLRGRRAHPGDKSDDADNQLVPRQTRKATTVKQPGSFPISVARSINSYLHHRHKSSRYLFYWPQSTFLYRGHMVNDSSLNIASVMMVWWQIDHWSFHLFNRLDYIDNIRESISRDVLYLRTTWYFRVVLISRVGWYYH